MDIILRENICSPTKRAVYKILIYINCQKLFLVWDHTVPRGWDRDEFWELHAARTKNYPLNISLSYFFGQRIKQQ